jgi:hypothetical protein
MKRLQRARELRKGCAEMKSELSDEIIHPKEFSEVLAKFNTPIGEQNRWLIRWGMIVGISLLAVVCLYEALVSGQITLFQLLLGSLAAALWMGVYVFFPVPMATVFNRLWNAGTIGPSCGHSSPSMTYQEVVSKDFRRIHSPWLQITAFLILVLFWFYQWETILKAWGVHSLLPLWNLGWIQLVILGLYTFINRPCAGLYRGQGPFPFALDTGASQSVVDLNVVQQLNIPITGDAGRASGVGGLVPAKLIRVDQWRVGDVPLSPGVYVTTAGPASRVFWARIFSAISKSSRSTTSARS